MKVTTYQPRVSVTLWKTVARQNLGDGAPVSTRFQQTASKLDLTPFLGEGSSVRTSKSTREAAGGFAITLLDRAYDGTTVDGADGFAVGTAESLYGLIEPMDLIEIRMCRTDPGRGATMPIVMRGFVSDVGRNEGMSQDGKPSRTVSVTGQDYGKLWQQLQILYLPGYVVGEDTITAFRLFERFGVGFETSMKAGKFVREVLHNILNVYVENLMPASTPMPKTIVLDEDQLVGHGTVSISGPQNKEGTVYDLMRTFTDVGIWNELFLEDREDGVFCVFRPNPFKGVDGKAIVADSLLPPSVEIDAGDIASISVGRSDANVANYFWVRGPRFELNDDIIQKQFAVVGDDRKTVLLGDHPNSSSKLYGIRAMFQQTEMGGDEVKTFNSGLPEADMVAREALQVNWLNYRRRLLVDANKDNVVFESGTMRIKGNESVRAGIYLKVRRGDLVSEVYCTHVTQDYMPMVGYTTTVRFERGTGFLVRAARNGGAESPYHAERLP